ncbi:unnamed protein product [Bursaphelenchus xylophilus]|uniref:(pine wood nematode) hypothetical protein n=1 Tax=Bursaphelenchus xylophilus TaxID=6326 RepID=A0A1I7SBR9_BURXY|nr:unnamed protein product [Bursaphelenchus xylophilus]CAG9111182.1 unnamed protein product [Bursaphelenchus xylophilus]
MLVPAYVYGMHPASVRCPYCGHNVVTVTRHRSTEMAWIVCFLLCVIGLWPCSLIPFCCCDNLQEVQHICSNCRHVLGAYRHGHHC